MIEVDKLLTQLQEAMNVFSLPTNSSDPEDQINQQIRIKKVSSGLSST